MSKKHKLKILPEFFEAVNDGRKTFELRENDRGYKTGDILILQEFDGEDYTGREISREVLYIYEGSGNYGLAPGYCILSIGENKRTCEQCSYYAITIDEDNKKSCLQGGLCAVDIKDVSKICRHFKKRRKKDPIHLRRWVEE